MEMHGVYKCVAHIGQKCISTRWVIMEKFRDKKKIMKAGLVEYGYEEEGDTLEREREREIS